MPSGSLHAITHSRADVPNACGRPKRTAAAMLCHAPARNKAHRHHNGSHGSSAASTPYAPHPPSTFFFSLAHPLPPRVVPLRPAVLAACQARTLCLHHDGCLGACTISYNTIQHCSLLGTRAVPSREPGSMLLGWGSAVLPGLATAAAAAPRMCVQSALESVLSMPVAGAAKDVLHTCTHNPHNPRPVSVGPGAGTVDAGRTTVSGGCLQPCVCPHPACIASTALLPRGIRQ